MKMNRLSIAGRLREFLSNLLESLVHWIERHFELWSRTEQDLHFTFMDQWFEIFRQQNVYKSKDLKFPTFDERMCCIRHTGDYTAIYYTGDYTAIFSKRNQNGRNENRMKGQRNSWSTIFCKKTGQIVRAWLIFENKYSVSTFPASNEIYLSLCHFLCHIVTSPGV